MEKIKIIDAINQIMKSKLNINKLLFYSEEVGYLCIDEIYFENEGIEVKNNSTNISDCLCFEEKLFLINNEKTIDR